jgi:sigma54-dependent transcription regulator
VTQHLKLRIHVTEPWDFERIAGTADIAGWTTDHADPDNEEWEVHLDEGFDYHDRHIGTLLAGPRYVGEHLVRMFDADGLSRPPRPSAGRRLALCLHRHDFAAP